MKILYFHQHFTTPLIGGGTRSYEFSQNLIKRGHRVTVVCGERAKLGLDKSDVKGVCRGEVDKIDVIQIKLPYSNRDSITKRTWIFVKFAFIGISIAMQEDYDLLFATSTPLTAGIPGIFAKWFRKKKFVFEVRDLWPELPKALGMKNYFLLVGMSLLEWLTYQNADACIGLSPGICDGIAKRSEKGKIITMIPNGCDLNIFKPTKRNRLILEGIKITDTVAVFAGAHGVANGLDAILNAALELKKLKRNDIILVFIGDGKMKLHLIERVKKEDLDNCRFFNPMSKVELNKVLSSSDIGIMALANIPAFYYGTSPNKFFDYISSGLPVLNNYPGWLADMILDNNCGVVVAPDDANALAKALICLSDDPKIRGEYGKNGRKLAESSFSRKDLANNFVDFIEKI